MNDFQYLHLYVTTNYTHSIPPVVNIYQFYLLIVSWTLIERIAFDFQMVFSLVFVRLNRLQKHEWIYLYVVCVKSTVAVAHTHTRTHTSVCAMKWNNCLCSMRKKCTQRQYTSICNSNNEAKVKQKRKRIYIFFFSQFRSTSSTCDRTYSLLLLAASVGMAIEYRKIVANRLCSAVRIAMLIALVSTEYHAKHWTTTYSTWFALNWFCFLFLYSN